MKTLLVLRCTVLAAAVVVAAAAHADSPDAAMSAVAGQWTGAWWVHPPAPMAPRPLSEDCRQRLDCTVVCENGGEYDWIGRAAGDGFVGFFTSSKHAGEFRLQRKKE